MLFMGAMQPVQLGNFDSKNQLEPVRKLFLLSGDRGKAKACPGHPKRGVRTASRVVYQNLWSVLACGSTRFKGLKMDFAATKRRKTLWKARPDAHAFPRSRKGARRCFFSGNFCVTRQKASCRGHADRRTAHRNMRESNSVACSGLGKRLASASPAFQLELLHRFRMLW